MQDDDARQWEGQFANLDPDCWALVAGVDYGAGWRLGRVAAGLLNDELAECGFEIWEMEATGGTLADGRAVVRMVGSSLAVQRLVRLLEAARRLAPPGAAGGGRGAA
ncbi:hypothetical protein ABIA33_007044 [Streptacidiphilus sp. MAP12-16]|uniref:hypothetical protein n=1 Tax=Streptacidiphilus sp. MAP12-16 TaxID=3156300 RepID=UPI0035141CE0